MSTPHVRSTQIQWQNPRQNVLRSTAKLTSWTGLRSLPSAGDAAQRIMCRSDSQRARAPATRATGKNESPLIDFPSTADENSTLEEPPAKTRRIVFAVDGTPASEQGLAWLSRNILQKSTDVVHLANVVCDSRTPSTGVGSFSNYAAHTQWTPSREERSFAKEIESKMAREATEMLEARYKPVLEMQGIECVMDILPLKLHKSAGGIAETIVHAAKDLGADLVVLCSHGPGARTDFGSVARWCEENSPIPTMLLPSSVLTQSNPPTVIQMGASNSILVAAADDMDGLKRSFDYAVTDHTRPGDGVYVVHAIDEKERSEDELMQLRKELVSNVLRWQAESPCPHAASLNVAVQLVLASAASDSSSSSSDEELAPCMSPAGADIVEMAARTNVRTVILAHHGKNMMREMLYKPLTLHCINNCQSPLIVLQEEKREGVIGY